MLLDGRAEVASEDDDWDPFGASDDDDGEQDREDGSRDYDDDPEGRDV